MINTIPKRPARRQAHELRCCAGGGEFGDVPPCHRAQFRSRRGRVGVGEAARTVVEWRGDSALGAGRCRAPRAVARGRRGGAGGVYTMFVTLYRNKNARGIYAHLTLCLLSSSSTLMNFGQNGHNYNTVHFVLLYTSRPSTWVQYCIVPGIRVQ